MTENVVFFTGAKDLETLTGLSHNELWDAGFNLDDMDFGLATSVEWDGHWFATNSPYYQYWMLSRMENHCVGYYHTEYNGKHYYTVHHS